MTKMSSLMTILAIELIPLRLKRSRPVSQAKTKLRLMMTIGNPAVPMLTRRPFPEPFVRRVEKGVEPRFAPVPLRKKLSFEPALTQQV